jgi:hypothetical protein
MFKMKLLAAVAAIGMSGAASAGINATSTGNTELVFNAYVNGVGYTFDLADSGFNSLFGSNVRMNSLIGSSHVAGTSATGAAQLAATTVSLTQSLSAGDIVFDAALTGFDSFMSVAGGATTFKWNVWSGESSGIRRIIQTVADTPTQKLETSSINSAVFAYSGFTLNNSQGGTHNANDVLVDGYRVTTDQDPELARAYTLGSRLAGSYASFGDFGDELDMYVVRGFGSGDDANLGGVAQLVGDNSLAVTAKVYVGDTGEYRLQIAVVPEPETYAMLLAGLGLIGFAARRRA